MTHSNTVLHQMLKYLDRDSVQNLDKGYFPPIRKSLTMIRPDQFSLNLSKHLQNRPNVQKRKFLGIQLPKQFP